VTTLPPLARLPLLLLGMAALVTGVLAGLARLAVAVPAAAAVHAGVHGPLMITAFLGTVISLERAVALGAAGVVWPYLAPLAAGLGGVALLLGLPLPAAQMLFVAAAAVLVAGSGVLWRRQPAVHLGSLALGAVSWLAGNLVWLVGGAVGPAVPWWLAFLVLTIAGERLELTRFLPVGPGARQLFLALVALLFAGLATASPDGQPHVVPVWQEWDGKHFYVIAWQGSLWAEYVLANPSISLTIDEPWPPLRRVLAHGRALPLPNPDLPGGPTGAEPLVESSERRRNKGLPNRLRRRYQEEILEGRLLVATEGLHTGQINGLAVVALGEASFAHPVRITATVRLGEGEVIDIEREVELGGPIHSKGVLILSSFLAGRFGWNMPLSLKASLVFEQSYGGVEGDSASLAELCALLSALAGVPIRQSLAVTGSVNQFGVVQPVGGINEKIEGFFDICAARGLTGDQGVLIPAANRRNLMLRDEVVEAARQGRFHIWAVASVDAAMELLTGLPAGEPDARGEIPPGSVNYLVVTQLAELALTRQSFIGQKSRRRRRKPARARPPVKPPAPPATPDKD